jgi:hypothetical protein
VATSLTGVEPLSVGFSKNLLARASGDDDRTFNGRIFAQVEMGRLAMTKGTASQLGAIVSSLPVGMI